MTTEIKQLKHVQSLGQVFRVCGVKNYETDEAKEITALVTTFCKQELPPTHTIKIDKSLKRNLRCYGDASYRHFIENDESSKVLKAKLAPYLDHAATEGSYDSTQVYFFLIHQINIRKAPDRRYANGRDGIAMVTSDRNVGKKPKKIPTPQVGGSVQDLATSLVTLSLQPKLTNTNNPQKHDNRQAEGRRTFAWTDVTFIIDITASSKSVNGEVSIPFCKTVRPEVQAPYTVKDFNSELLKQALMEVPCLAGIDLTEKLLRHEGLQQSFRLVQSDMVTLLKAILAENRLPNPQSRLELKLLDRFSKKRQRDVDSQPDSGATQDRSEKRRHAAPGRSIKDNRTRIDRAIPLPDKSALTEKKSTSYQPRSHPARDQYGPDHVPISARTRSTRGKSKETNSQTEAMDEAQSRREDDLHNGEILLWKMRFVDLK